MGDTTVDEQTWSRLLAHIALGLTLSVFVAGTVTDLVVRAEQFSADDSAAMWFLLTWLLAAWAVLAWLGSAWTLATHLVTQARRAVRINSLAWPRQLAELTLVAGLFALAFAAWPPFGTGSAWG